MGRKQFMAAWLRSRASAPVIMFMGSDMYWATLPWPTPKKSPMGASMLGCSSPSHHARSTSERGQRRSSEFTVIQMCLMMPAPEMSASTWLFPAGIGTQSLFAPVRS